jgi:Domain of unknown function (DUF4159)
MTRTRLVRRLAAVAALFIAAGPTIADVADAQEERPRRGRRWRFGGQDGDYYVPPDFTGNTRYDGKFTFARIKYRGMGCFAPEGPGWAHDYPVGERNLMQILRDVTSMRPFMEGGNILALDDPELFKYPVAYLSEPGCWEASESDVKALRAYLLKGGFLIFDDFGDRRPYCPGDGAELLNAQYQIQRAIPGAQLVRLTESHPIFDSFFKIESLNTLSEGGYRCDPEYYGIFEGNDPKKRLIAILNNNNDIGDFWQYSATGFVPIPISNEAYKLGVNYIVYALTH